MLPCGGSQLWRKKYGGHLFLLRRLVTLDQFLMVYFFIVSPTAEASCLGEGRGGGLWMIYTIGLARVFHPLSSWWRYWLLIVVSA